MQEQIWLGSCNAVLPKPAKTVGKLSSDYKKHGGQTYFACIFLFSKTFLLGSNTNWWHLMHFSPGTRLVSDGLNVRRVLRVSIIIKSSFSVWILKLLWPWGCLEKEPGMLSQILGVISTQVAEGLIFPKSLSIAGSGHPRAATITEG